MSVTNIRFSDLIQFPDDNNVKIRFNSDNGYYNPLDIYPTKRDEAALEWLRWRPERACFYVGNLVINFFRMSFENWLLVGIHEIISDTGIAQSDAYDSKILEEYRQYYGRLVVKTDPPGRNYNRLYTSCKESLIVSEILREIYSGAPFCGVRNVRACWWDLFNAMHCGRQDWISSLSAQKGIYLITDKHTHERYVGSAYGSEGIWQRWMCYVITEGHGGNVELMRRIKEDPEYGKKNFEFAVLETFGSSTGDDEILQRESWWKDTLGSRSEMNRN